MAALGVDASWFIPVQKEDEIDPVADLFEKVVERVVLERAARNELFTAYDITKDLRAIGMQVKHDDVNGVVHTLYANTRIPGYSRSLLPVADGKPEVFIYHVCGQDAYEYNDYTRSLTSDQSVYTDVEEEDDENEGYGTDVADTLDIKAVDDLCRLRIPDNVLRAAGFLPGDAVNVVWNVSRNEIVILPEHVNFVAVKGDQFISKPYRVDQYGNVRICLKKAGIDADQFEIVADGDMVIARAR